MISLSVGAPWLTGLIDALFAEGSGKVLRDEMASSSGAGMMKVASSAKANLMAISSAGLDDPSIRGAIANQMTTKAVRASKWSGAQLIVGTQGMPRQFTYAARRLNSIRGWLRRGVRQLAVPTQWFDRATVDTDAMFRDSLENVVKKMFSRIFP